jgi:RNA polymerase sigma factor (sigma-70 family)
MGEGQPGCSLRRLRALFAAGTATGLTDGELLERYAARRSESAEAAAAAEMAFAALVDRHGPMVWGVCRRVLGDAHEAEDAFQATFLVLVRKIRSVRVDGSLGRWLYGVAHRVAIRARSEAERRRSGIDRVPTRSSDDPVGDVELRDLRDAVSEELDRLPAKYRCPVELCHLQGMTYDQAARELNWPVATVKSRLTKGRLRLRERLARRGLAPGAVAGGLATALTVDARAAVPQALARSTVRAATSCATGSFPAAVIDLTEGVLKMMMWERLKYVAVGALVAVGLTARALSQQAPDGGIPAARPPQAAAQRAEKPDQKWAGDRRWVRSLPSGAIVEVVGVSSVPTGPDTWWRPDGSPLHPAPCDPSRDSRVSGGNRVRVRVVVRLARIPDGANCKWSITEAGGWGEAPAKRDGKLVPGLREMITSLPADAGTCTAHFKVEAGSWRTILTWEKGSGGEDLPDGTTILHGEPIATRVGTMQSVTHNIRDKSVRLVAVAEDGEELSCGAWSFLVAKDFQHMDFICDRPPERIKEYRLQTRPYEEVEIPHIALKRK